MREKEWAAWSVLGSRVQVLSEVIFFLNFFSLIQFWQIWQNDLFTENLDWLDGLYSWSMKLWMRQHLPGVSENVYMSHPFQKPHILDILNDHSMWSQWWVNNFTCTEYCQSLINQNRVSNINRTTFYYSNTNYKIVLKPCIKGLLVLLEESRNATLHM